MQQCQLESKSLLSAGEAVTFEQYAEMTNGAGQHVSKTSLTCAPAVPRGLALAWFVFPAAPTYAVYAAVIAGDWAWSVVSTCLMRRIKDIPKPQLAKDVACIVLCYSFPLFAASAAEVWAQVGQ